MPSWPLPPTQPPIYRSTPGGVSAPDLDDYQAAYNGVTFGAGTSIDILKLHGLGGLPIVSAHDLALPRDTGEIIGVDSMGGRDPAADLIVTSDIFTQMVALGGALQAGGLVETPFWFKLPGLPTLCSMVRPRTRVTDWDSALSTGVWSPTLQFHATDPRLYAEGQTILSPAGGSSVSMTVTNAGNVETRPILIFTGPLSAAWVEFGSATPPIKIALASGTGIASGDQLVIDLSTPHTCRYWTGGVIGGTVTDAYNLINQATTSWPTLVPGDNTLTFHNGTIYSTAANQLQVWWSSAFML